MVKRRRKENIKDYIFPFAGQQMILDAEMHAGKINDVKCFFGITIPISSWFLRPKKQGTVVNP